MMLCAGSIDGSARGVEAFLAEALGWAQVDSSMSATDLVKAIQEQRAHVSE